MTQVGLPNLKESRCSQSLVQEFYSRVAKKSSEITGDVIWEKENLDVFVGRKELIISPRRLQQVLNFKQEKGEFKVVDDFDENEAWNNVINLDETFSKNSTCMKLGLQRSDFYLTLQASKADGKASRK